MIREETDFPGIYLLKPKVYRDRRGYFMETFREEYFHDLGLPAEFNQDNLSASEKGVVRGLHYQIGEAAQKKLVLVCCGEILDVVVDIRKESPNFGKHLSFRLSDRNPKMLYIAQGYAHGFSVLSEKAVIYYKCDVIYNPDKERGIRWNDPELNIDWKVDKPILSEKDKNQPLFKELNPVDLL